MVWLLFQGICYNVALKGFFLIFCCLELTVDLCLFVGIEYTLNDVIGAMRYHCPIFI